MKNYGDLASFTNKFLFSLEKKEDKRFEFYRKATQTNHTRGQDFFRWKMNTRSG